MKSKCFKIFRIMETSYEDGTSWVEYICNGKYGYEIIEDIKEIKSFNERFKLFNHNIRPPYYLSSVPSNLFMKAIDIKIIIIMKIAIADPKFQSSIEVY